MYLFFFSSSGRFLVMTFISCGSYPKALPTSLIAPFIPKVLQVTIAEQLKLTDSYGSKGYVDKNILAVNVNKENSDSSVFKSLDKYYTDNNSSYFKGNSNISNSAGSYLSNIKSNDSLSSSVKTTSLNSATLSKISNLFI